MIFDNDNVFTFCVYFYLDEISEWLFQQEMRDAEKEGISERQFLSTYFAARIPGEACYEKMMMKILEIAAKT